MVILAALIGLVIGNLFNLVIARHLRLMGRGRLVRAAGPAGWVPLAGSVRTREWIGLAVEVVCALMAAALWYRYGITGRTVVLFGATLLLVDTGAIDFKIRLIDTQVIVIATLVVLALAPLSIGGTLHRPLVAWLSSAFGLLMAIMFFAFLYGLAKLMFRNVATPFGLGDVFLGAFIGALVGAVALPAALFLGIALAGIVALVLIVLRTTGRTVPTYIAYGTYLCLGTLLFLATGRL